MRSLLAIGLACLGMMDAVSSQAGRIENVTLTLRMKLDDFPSETGWELVDTGGNIFGSAIAGTYGSARATINEEIEVIPGQSYTFTIEDSGGDGICCFMPGWYNLTHEDGTVYVEGVGNNFESSKATTFEVSLVMATNQPAPRDPTQAPVEPSQVPLEPTQAPAGGTIPPVPPAPTDAPTSSTTDAPTSSITDAPTSSITDAPTSSITGAPADTATLEPSVATIDPEATQAPIVDVEPSMAPVDANNNDPTTVGPAAETPFICYLCGDPGLRIADPEGIISADFFGDLTCAEWDDLASQPGVVAFDLCSEIQPTVEDSCGCEVIPPSAAPTIPPPTTPPPVALYVCPICGGEGYDISIPDAVVSIPTQEDRTCAEVKDLAETGQIPATQCPIVETYTQLVCGCELIDPSLTSAPAIDIPPAGPPTLPPASAADRQLSWLGWLVCSLAYLPLLGLVTRM